MSDDTSLQTETDELDSSFEVPDKYKGKSPEDLIKMHMEAERDRSRLGNEVGLLRATADKLLGLEQDRTKTNRESRKPITTDELLTNPDESLERAIESNPRLAKLEQENEQLRVGLAQQNFERDYPDYQKDLQDPGFVDWVKANKVRTALGQAANSGNYDAAGSLWSLWQERQADLSEIKVKKKELTKKAEKMGTLEGSGTGGLESEKTYSRLEFMELQTKAARGDPEARAKWNDPKFQEQRLQAYADKRVK